MNSVLFMYDQTAVVKLGLVRLLKSVVNKRTRTVELPVIFYHLLSTTNYKFNPRYKMVTKHLLLDLSVQSL